MSESCFRRSKAILYRCISAISIFPVFSIPLGSNIVCLMRKGNTENRDFCIKVKKPPRNARRLFVTVCLFYFEVLILADGRKSNIRFKCYPSYTRLMRIFTGWLLGPCCSMGLKKQMAGMSSKKDISPSGNCGMVLLTRPTGSSGVKM